MDDLISRRAAMNEFAERVKRSNNSDFAPTPTWNDAVEIVENLPSVDVPHWIPCSERLPLWSEHKDEMVLVCDENGSVRFNTFMHGEWVRGNPKAWMPIPEPWRGKQDEP